MTATPSSLRGRLLAIVVLTGATAAIAISTGVLSLWRVDRELTAIEGSYLPLLTLEPDVRRQFENLSKHLQEATVDLDEEAQMGTRAAKERLIETVRTAPAIVDLGERQQLERDIDTWYQSAFALSSRLMRGEAGERTVSEIASMQQKRRRVEAEITSTLGLDRARLSAAFARAIHAQRTATLVNTAIPVGLIIAVALIALGIRRSVSGSLLALTEGFSRFGRGEFDRPIPEGGDDELGAAARDANRMAASLRELDAQLRGQQADLERANRELEAFSYSVSHDLRAPLRSIDGFSQALLEDYAKLLPETGQQYLGRVRANAQRMAELIDDMLRLSRISREKMVLEDVDLSALAREVGEGLAHQDPDRPVELHVQDGILAWGDKKLLRIVFENLLGNARKFASRVEKPQIWVEAGPRTPAGEVVVAVRDNGAGFDMRYVDKLFGPFQRLHATSEFPGTGIGLATVQRVIHRHGGQVRAHGVVGQGATFTFSLPPASETP
jgi:signal transduction histidine kinase